MVPALAVATVDASLDLAVRYGSERSLYGGRVLDIPHARALLAGAIADFLVADALSAVVVRALHLAPADCLVLTAVSKALVPQLLMSAMDDLSVLFGSTFYARVPPYDVFEKFLRDLAVVPIGHDGSTACLLTILPNLPAWLRRSRRTAATDPALFRLGDDLDELAFDRFTLGAGDGDPLGAALRDPAIRASFGSGAASEALDRLAIAFDGVRDEIAALGPSELGDDAPPEAFAAVHRLTLALAAGAFGGRLRRERGLDDDARSARAAGRAPAHRGPAPRRPRSCPSIRRWSTASWRSPTTSWRATSASTSRPETIRRSRRAGGRRTMNTDAATIESWLMAASSPTARSIVGSFTPDTPLAELGLDSVYALTLCGDIEDTYELDVDPTIVWDYPTIRSLAGGISERLVTA